MRRFTDEEVFKLGSNYPRHLLKNRFLKMVPYCCAICGQDGTWNGKKLVLQLDHKNGIHNDNRFENLQLICPNCHSQTETYAGRNSTGMRTAKVKPNLRLEKAIADREKWKRVKEIAEIRFGEWGWQVRISKYLNITPQKVMKWIQRVDPEFYGSLV